MTETVILIGFAVIANIFTWWSVSKSTKEHTVAADNLAFQNEVVTPLLLDYGVDQVVNGVPTKVLPPNLDVAVKRFYARG